MMSENKSLDPKVLSNNQEELMRTISIRDNSNKIIEKVKELQIFPKHEAIWTLRCHPIKF